MKKVFTLILVLGLSKACFSQVVKSFTHPAGYGLSATAAHLTNNGYLVASKYSDGVQTLNYITCYQMDGTISWTKTENSGLLNGIMDMAENSQKELYFLAEDMARTQFYGLIKTDSMGNTLWTVNLAKKGFISYETPKICVNANDEVYVLSSTYEKTHIYKLADNGNLLWSKTIEVDTTAAKNPAFDVITTEDGGIIYAGKASDEIYIERLDANGTVVWTKQLFDNGQAMSQPKALAKMADGNYLLTGFRTETSGAYASGPFIIKMDGNGMLKDYKFYHDSLGRYGFVPHAICETQDGHIRAMGCGGVLTFAEFDANLNLEKYSIWNTVGNFMTSASGYHYQNDQLLVTGTDNQTTQYILRNDLTDLGDFCDQQEITSMVQTNLPIDNNLYVTSPEETTGPAVNGANYALQNTTGFVTSAVCGNNEMALSTTENMNEDVVNVYPNPVSNSQVLNLNLSWNDETTVQLMNAGGQLVLQQTTKGQNPQVNMNQLPAGMYFLNLVVNEKPRFTTKIIVY